MSGFTETFRLGSKVVMHDLALESTHPELAQVIENYQLAKFTNFLLESLYHQLQADGFVTVEFTAGEYVYNFSATLTGPGSNSYSVSASITGPDGEEVPISFGYSSAVDYEGRTLVLPKIRM